MGTPGHNFAERAFPERKARSPKRRRQQYFIYNIIIIILSRTKASRLLWLPPQITRGRVRQAVSQAAEWLHHAARGVVLAGAVGTVGNTVDGVVRVLMRRTITSRPAGVMSNGQEQQSCPEGPGMTPLMASHKEAGAMGGLGRDGLNLRGSRGGHRGARQDGEAIGVSPGRARTRGIKDSTT